MIHYEVRFVKFIGVGFHVGGKSAVKYMVLQVHYANVEQFKSKLYIIFYFLYQSIH